MRRQPGWMSLVVVLGWPALPAQDLAKPTFEVESVRQTAPSSDGRIPVMQCIGGPDSPDPELLRCTNAPLAMLICIAYGVQYYQVAGPGWMSTDGYDISAKIPPGTTQAQYKLMLQALLAERFHLALHHEYRGRATYSLLVAKGGNKMQVSAPKNAPPDGTKAPYPVTTRTDAYQIHVTANGATAQQLAGFLSTKPGVEGPVANETGLTGTYDFKLDFTYEPAALAGVDNGVSLFAALESQLGLRLETKKSQVDTLVVDHTEKTPTDN